MKKIISIFIACCAAVAANAQIGGWSFTDEGLPVYQYKGSVPFEAVDEFGNDSQQPEDPYFFIGNYRLGLFTHVSGIYQFITAGRAWARVNAEENRPNYGRNHARVTVKAGKGLTTELVGLKSISANPAKSKRYFGVGFARYEYDLDNGLSCIRVISVKPSAEIHEGTPSFLVSVTLKNNGRRRVELDYEEGLTLNYVPMGVQMKAKEDRPYSYPAEMTVDNEAKTVEAALSTKLETFMLMPEKHQRSRFEVAPPSVFMKAEGKELTVRGEGDVMEAKLATVLKPGESRTIYITVGLKDSRKFSTLEEQLAAFMNGAELSDVKDGVFAGLWKKKLPDFSSEKDEVLRREMTWHAYFIEATAKYSEYFNETFIPQGSVYSYHDGDNIANRDHLQAVLPACYTNPALAKSALRYVMKHTEPDGEIKRGNLGFGYTPPIIYKESDQQLYMFYSVAEYLRITGDYAFLDEKVELYPAEEGRLETVGNVLKRNFMYLRDEIGLGPNGLIMLHNSDWSDSFLHRHSPNVVGWTAESHLNSAMALAAIPMLTDALRASGRADQNDFIKALESYRYDLEQAYMKDLGDRKFSARAYLTHEHRFGLDNVCIEPHSYLFQIPSLSVERKKEIYSYIRERISDPEKIGIRTRERSMWGGRPEGEDGGIWYSLEYPLLMGVASFDKEEAKSLLRKFTLDNYSKNYPQYWVGHWTAPDEINSTLYREGLYTIWIPVANRRHCPQGYCCHPHCWPLYCYYRLYHEK